MVIRETKGDEILTQLKALNWIFFCDEEDFDDSVKMLLTSIHTDYDWVQANRRQVKTFECECDGMGHGAFERYGQWQGDISYYGRPTIDHTDNGSGSLRSLGEK